MPIPDPALNQPPESDKFATDSPTLADGTKTIAEEKALAGGKFPLPVIPSHELITRVGQGSYGEVWLARNVMGTYRAVKIVYRATFEHARPFEREFTGIKKFEPISRSHDGFVDILQIGRTDDYFYYVMELADDQVTGQQIDPAHYIPKSLRSEVQEHRRLPFEKCLELGISLTQALERLHQHGLIHRDVKPSNIIFVNGIPKLADIGLVAEQSEAKSFVGTEGFIPPEGPGRPQADIYSLGKVLYEIATGKDRHEFPELPTILGEEKEDDHLLELNSVFLKACQSDIKLRYQTAEQMRDDLVLLQTGKSVQRAQTLERRLALLTRIGFIGAAVTVVAIGAFLFVNHLRLRAARAEQETKRQLYVSDMIVAQKALTEGNVHHVEELLDGHVPKPGAREDLRGFEYYYLRQQCAGDQAFTFPPQECAVFAVAYSPDGKVLATGSSYLEEKDYSGALKFFDVQSRKEIHTFVLTGPGGIPTADGIRSVAFSPDGKVLASGSAGSVLTIWDAVTHQKLDSFFGNSGPVKRIAFSTNGRLLAALFSGRLVFWDTIARKETNLFKLRADYSSPVAFSPDGKTLGFADGNTLRIGDLDSQRVVAETVLPFDGDIFCLDVSVDSQTVAFGVSSGFVALWEIKSQRVVKLGKHQYEVVSAAFSRDGRHLVTSSADGTIKLWDPSGRSEVRILKGHRESVEQVVFSSDGTHLASASHDKTVRLWPVAPAEMDVLRGHSKGVMAVDFSPDGKLLATASGEHTVKIWDPSTRELRQTLTSITNEVQSVAFSPDGKYLAAGCLEQGAKLWEAGTWQEVTNLTCVDTWGGVSRLRFSLDGKFLVTGTGGFAQVWEAGSWRALTNLVGGARTGVAFSRDSRLLATAGAAGITPTVQLWEVGTWRLFNTMIGHNKGISNLTFTPDGHTLVTGSDDSTIRIWDVSSGQKKALLKGHAGSVRALAISRDGKTLASSDMTGAIKLWNLATGKELFTLVGHDASVLSLAFSPDGLTLASGSSDTTVRLWRSSIPETSNAAAERQR